MQYDIKITKETLAYIYAFEEGEDMKAAMLKVLGCLENMDIINKLNEILDALSDLSCQIEDEQGKQEVGLIISYVAELEKYLE